MELPLITYTAVPVLCLLATGTVKCSCWCVGAIRLCIWNFPPYSTYVFRFKRYDRCWPCVRKFSGFEWFACSWNCFGLQLKSLLKIWHNVCGFYFCVFWLWIFSTRFVNYTCSIFCKNLRKFIHTRAFPFIPQETTQATCYEHLLHQRLITRLSNHVHLQILYYALCIRILQV